MTAKVRLITFLEHLGGTPKMAHFERNSAITSSKLVNTIKTNVKMTAKVRLTIFCHFAG